MWTPYIPQAIMVIPNYLFNIREPVISISASSVAGSMTIPITANSIPAQILPTIIFSFSNGTMTKNLKPRSNGQVLVSLNTAPDKQQINPFCNQSGHLIHSFDGYTSTFGIVEAAQDVFYVIDGNFISSDFFGIKDMFRLDLIGLPNPTVESTRRRVTKVLDIPEAQILDCFIMVNPKSHPLLAGDNHAGSFFPIDAIRRKATKVLTEPLLAGLDDDLASGFSGHLGINGLKMHGNSAFYTNTAPPKNLASFLSI